MSKLLPLYRVSATYWGSNGTLQSACQELHKLVPASGSVTNPRSKNKKLECFRKAVNCYYDLYNNGLCNRAQEFRYVFDIASSKFRMWDHSYHESLYAMVEEKMTQIIAEAAQEQNIKVV